MGISLMPPLPKTCSKMVSAPQKGVAFLTKDVFEKKFSGAGEGSAVGASGSTYGSAAIGEQREGWRDRGHPHASGSRLAVR